MLTAAAAREAGDLHAGSRRQADIHGRAIRRRHCPVAVAGATLLLRAPSRHRHRPELAGLHIAGRRVPPMALTVAMAAALLRDQLQGAACHHVAQGRPLVAAAAAVAVHAVFPAVLVAVLLFMLLLLVLLPRLLTTILLPLGLLLLLLVRSSRTVQVHGCGAGPGAGRVPAAASRAAAARLCLCAALAALLVGVFGRGGGRGEVAAQHHQLRVARGPLLAQLRQGRAKGGICGAQEQGVPSGQQSENVQQAYCRTQDRYMTSFAGRRMCR